MNRVCIVTDELHPFTSGGIGRLVHNLIRDSLRRSTDVELHLVLPAHVSITTERIHLHFGDRVKAHYVRFREGFEPEAENGANYPPAGAFTDSDWHAQSLDLMRALKTLTANLRFSVIEFPDYRGWAFATLQEKLLGLGFAQTEIAVRIHSTDGVLQAFEPRDPSMRQLARFDLERKALYDAERVVTHLETVSAFNARYYGFDVSWKAKVTVQFPPVLDGDTPADVPRDRARDLLFITKQQAVKRPDVFIRGAATFLRGHPEFGGRAVLACAAADDAYALKLRALVPADLQSRFLFLPSGPERQELMPGSIVVIPSAYESLNLAAYEAAAAGAQLVLNGACVAFGEGSPWRNGVNCHKFDGTVDGLAETLERAAASPPPETVQWKADAPYWLSPSPASVNPAAGRERPLVSVIIPNFNLGRWLPETLSSLAASAHPELEVIVVDDASTDPLDALMLDQLDAARNVRVIRNPVNRGLSASRNIGIRNCRGKYVLPLDADDCIAPRFIEVACEALEAHPEFDVVVPTAGFFDTDADLAERRYADYAVFVGDAPSLGLVANRMSCATALIRRSLYDELQYDEALDSYEDWSLYLRAAHRGSRFLVTNDVQFHYRRRPGSMIRGVTPERHVRLLERMFASLETMPSVRLNALLAPVLQEMRTRMALEQELAGRSPSSGLHELADRVNATVKKLPMVHSLLRATAERLHGGGSGRPLRHELSDKLRFALKRLPLVHLLLKATAQRLTGVSRELP